MLDISFSSFFQKAENNSILLEDAEGVLTHLTHLEELILTSKQQGLDIALRFLETLYGQFKGHTDNKTFVTVKIDGAPACIAGINPENNKFFVSTKSLGNVTPKVNYTDEDVEKNHGHAPGLVKKLKLALKYLPAVITNGVYQGDFLFDKEDLRTENIDGEDLIVFKPNTITYAVEAHSSLGHRIMSSKMGIIFHTKYEGPSLQNLKKSSDVNVSDFNQTTDVFVDDAKFKDVSGLVSFTKKESSRFETLLSTSRTAGKRIKWDELSDVVYSSLNVFINSLIRTGRFVEDVEETFNEFIQWSSEKLQKAADALKTEKGKAKKQQQVQLFLDGLQQNKMNILNLLNLSKKLKEAKSMFIQKYNAAIKTRQFITQPDGSLKVTAPEGYVAVDHLGNMVKFVDRLEFSAANFSISKGDKFK